MQKWFRKVLKWIFWKWFIEANSQIYWYLFILLKLLFVIHLNVSNQLWIKLKCLHSTVAFIYIDTQFLGSKQKCTFFGVRKEFKTEQNLITSKLMYKCFDVIFSHINSFLYHQHSKFNLSILMINSIVLLHGRSLSAYTAWMRSLNSKMLFIHALIVFVFLFNCSTIKIANKFYLYTNIFEIVRLNCWAYDILPVYLFHFDFV